VSWLTELEEAEDAEDDAAKRKQIHQVVSATAATIIARYIAEDAPQQINISAATFNVLRNMGGEYKRGMFNGAVGEVKLMLDTDILPRFQSSVAYAAMSENLFVNSLGAEESGLSSESDSTAGSILSDDETGPSNMVAFNFRNLYATFDDDMDVGSTCDQSSVIDDPEMSNATDPLTEKKTGTVSSIKDSSTDSKEKITQKGDAASSESLSSDKKSEISKKSSQIN